MDYGKSCCGCCPPDCDEHVNVRPNDRHYVQLIGMDGRATFVLMTTDAQKSFAFADDLARLLNKYQPDRGDLAYPNVMSGTIERYQTSKYEETWQKIESGQALAHSYDPFDY